MKKFAWLFLISLFNLFLVKAHAADNGLTLTFSFQRGYYHNPFSLVLTTNDPLSTIVYTSDCSIPSKSNGTVYKTGFEISKTSIIKAIAFSAKDTSVLESHTYLFIEDVKRQVKNPVGFPSTWGGSSTIDADYEMDPWVINHSDYTNKITDALKSLPVLSLSMPVDEWFNHQTGMYVGYPNSNITREKAVAAEFIYADGSDNFGINCGVQNQGGTSIVDWKVPKQSMRLLFKEQYGPNKLKKKLFPDSDIKSINTLVIDGFLYGWVHPWDKKQCETSLFFRDQLCSDMQNSMGSLSFHGIYVHLFINGIYWGMYDLHERPDEHFLAEYFDTETSDFDIIKHNANSVVSGSNISYKSLLTIARSGFETPGSLDKIRPHLDLEAFIDYIILNFYLGNSDWAHQNYYAACNTVLGTGYRFYTWDAEHVMRYSDVNFDATKKSDSGGPTEIHTNLKANEEYRMMFADAFYKHAFNNGTLSIENFEKIFLYRKNEIDLATILESARWGDYLKQQNGTTYTRNDHWIPEVNKVLSNYIPNRRDVVIKQLQRSDNLLYPTTLPPAINKYGGYVKKGEQIEMTNLNNLATSRIMYTTDGTDPRKTDGQVYSVQSKILTVDGSLRLKSRTLNTQTNEWSPLVECYFVSEGLLNKLVITEIMYHSPNDDLEFIELMNTGDKVINLMGVSFLKGIEYTFKNEMLLSPGSCVVLTNNEALFESFYRLKAFDVYNKKLSNSGETLILSDYFGNVIDSVSYSDSAPWPKEADGKGWSLELKSPDKDNALASSWRSSTSFYGSPGSFISVGNSNMQLSKAGISVFPNPASNWINVNINEHQISEEETWFEFYNNSGQLAKKTRNNSLQAPISINIDDLRPGIYYIRLQSKNGQNTTTPFKLIKIN